MLVITFQDGTKVCYCEIIIFHGVSISVDFMESLAKNLRPQRIINVLKNIETWNSLLANTNGFQISQF